MARVPNGDFIMGADDNELAEVIKKFGHRGDFNGYDFNAEKPKRHLYLKAFYIDKHEVTNSEYLQFIEETDHKTPRHWRGSTFPQDKRDNPVTYVSWFDANSYCKWIGKRLPTEEEWEKAARGSDGRIYPWGNNFSADNAVTAEYVLKHFRNPGELSLYAATVNYDRGDKSPYGVYDLTGNVMEWTDSHHDDGLSRVVKGASWVNLIARARSSAKDGILPDHVSHLIGFRCASDERNMKLKFVMNVSGTSSHFL